MNFLTIVFNPRKALKAHLLDEASFKSHTVHIVALIGILLNFLVFMFYLGSISVLSIIVALGQILILTYYVFTLSPRKFLKYFNRIDASKRIQTLFKDKERQKEVTDAFLRIVRIAWVVLCIVNTPIVIIKVLIISVPDTFYQYVAILLEVALYTLTGVWLFKIIYPKYIFDKSVGIKFIVKYVLFFAITYGVLTFVNFYVLTLASALIVGSLSS